MMLHAHSSMNLVARHFIAEPVSLFLCILKPEAYAQKLDRSKTPAQLHIMNWHPDKFPISEMEKGSWTVRLKLFCSDGLVNFVS